MKIAYPIGCLFVALLGSSCIHTWEKSQGPSDEQLLELYTTTASYLYEDDSLERAQGQAVKALEIDPDNKAMRRMVAWIRLRMGQNEDLIISEQLFRELYRGGDRNQATVLGLATVLERLGAAYDHASREIGAGVREPSEGMTAEKEAAKLAKRSTEYWNESVEFYEQVLDTGEGSTNAMNGLQRVYALLGEYERSLVESNRLLERSGEELAIWRRMLTQSELTEREESLFRENERAAADLQRETHLFAATVLNRQGRYAEGIEHLDAVTGEFPDVPQVYSLRAQLHSRVGDYDRALADLDRFLQLSDLPYEHPDVRRAFELRAEFERKLTGE